LESEFKSGLTARSLMGIIYALLCFSPAALWVSLYTVGANLPAIAIDISSLLVIVEFTRLSGKPLSKQEAAIIYNLSGLTGVSTYFLNAIYAEYYVNSPIVKRFGLEGVIPSWWAPPPETGVWEYRTFLNPHWVLPISIRLISTCIAIAMGISLGLIGRELFIEAERLSFPMQAMYSEIVVDLAERRPRKLVVLSGASLVGFLYGFLLYVIPQITDILGVPIQMIPIPWFDFNRQIQAFFPGASFGIATDILLVSSGLILPLKVIIGMFIGSFSLFFLGNWLLVKYGLTNWATRWVPGMNIQTAFNESVFTFWVNPTIGIVIAIGIVPLLLRSKEIVESLRTSYGGRRISGRMIPLKIPFTIFILAGLSSTFLNWYLAPDAPKWIVPLLSIGYPLLGMLVFGRMVGETGFQPDIPYFSNLIILGSGYKGYNLWLAPIIMAPGTGWLRNFKICQLVKIDPISYIKAYLIALPLALLLSFILVSAFWMVAPIPSSAYPAPEVMWPYQATYLSLWLTRRVGFFQPMTILYSFLATVVVAVILEIIGLEAALIGMSVGIGIPIPSCTTMLIAAIAGKIIEHIKGKQWWSNYRLSVAGGLAVGEGLAIVFGSGMRILSSSLWLLPF